MSRNNGNTARLTLHCYRFFFTYIFFFFFLHQFPNVYKIANTKTNFLYGMVQTEMRVISSMVIKFPYSDARSQGPQGVLRSHSAPNNQICNAATNSLRWREARILCQGQPWVTACLGCPQAESKEKGEMQDRSMSPPLRSLPGPPSTVNSCLIWTPAAHHEGCYYSLWNGLADIMVRCVLLCLPQNVSDLRSKSMLASQPNCPVTTVWKRRRVAYLGWGGVQGRGGCCFAEILEVLGSHSLSAWAVSPWPSPGPPGCPLLWLVIGSGMGMWPKSDQWDSILRFVLKLLKKRYDLPTGAPKLIGWKPGSAAGHLL